MLEAKMEEETLQMIDEGKKLANNHRFEESFQTFQEVINRFKKLGWINQIPFIQKEMENTKVLEDKYKDLVTLVCASIYSAQDALGEKSVIDSVTIKNGEIITKEDN